MVHEKTVLGLNPSGFHRMVYSEWGPPDSPHVIICVHGLTRNRFSFDFLARKLSRRYRVICPDVVGRGSSDALPDPAFYNYQQYLSDMTALIARSNAEKIIWIGTSMGGIMGMMLASLPKSPINRLILNDVGMVVPATGIQELKKRTEYFPTFSSLEEAFLPFKKDHAHEYGDLSDEVWKEVIQHRFHWNEEKKYWQLAYDPALVSHFLSSVSQSEDWDLSAYWKAISCPCFILRGTQSYILTQETAQRMVSLKPGTDYKEFWGFGHPLPLICAEQINAIEAWLDVLSS